MSAAPLLARLRSRTVGRALCASIARPHARRRGLRLQMFQDHLRLRLHSRPVLRRVSERGDVTSWIPDRYDEYEAALIDPRFGVSIDTTERSPEAVLDAILQALPRPLPESAPLP
jgi:hypothetical protein